MRSVLPRKSLTQSRQRYIHPAVYQQLYETRSKRNWMRWQPVTSLTWARQGYSLVVVRPDREKIQAILQLTEPEDVTALKQFLGMVNYLAKFKPHLSEMPEPLRRLEDENVEFQRSRPRSLAMDTIKKFLTEASLLYYYDVSKPITVQNNASQCSLGAVLLPDVQPVCYASRTFNDAQSRHVQIEKEMLASNWSCDKFDRTKHSHY